MNNEEILAAVERFHCLHDPAVELPALFDAFASTKAERALEIGTYRGATTTALALKFPDATIWTVDLPDPMKASNNAQNKRWQGRCFQLRQLDKHGRIKQLLFDSKEIPERLGEFESFFDLVFVDGDHSEAACYRDVHNAVPLLREGGIIVVHDYTSPGESRRSHWTKNVERAVTRFCKETGWGLERLPGWLASIHPPPAAQSDPPPVSSGVPPEEEA